MPILCSFKSFWYSLVYTMLCMPLWQVLKVSLIIFRLLAAKEPWLCVQFPSESWKNLSWSFLPFVWGIQSQQPLLQKHKYVKTASCSESQWKPGWQILWIFNVCLSSTCLDFYYESFNKSVAFNRWEISWKSGPPASEKRGVILPKKVFWLEKMLHEKKHKHIQFTMTPLDELGSLFWGGLSIQPVIPRKNPSTHNPAVKQHPHGTYRAPVKLHWRANAITTRAQNLGRKRDLQWKRLGAWIPNNWNQQQACPWK